jgi:hypothetical protein
LVALKHQGPKKRFMFRITLHAFTVIVLTLLTQIGGLAWITALFFRWRLLAFTLVYVTFSALTIWIAPQFGRVAVSCLDDGPLQVQSWMYCALNRTYVTPEMAQVLQDTANEVNNRFPGTTTLLLDGNFPFVTGFPLLPHLSHDDGEKADLAFYYRDGKGYLPGQTRSPLGYFAFEDGPTQCEPTWPSLRWDLNGLQPLWRSYALDADRTRFAVQTLARDPRVDKIFVEPHLVDHLQLSHPKIRFQGCRAARHDDHIHFQL